MSRKNSLSRLVAAVVCVFATMAGAVVVAASTPAAAASAVTSPSLVPPLTARQEQIFQHTVESLTGRVTQRGFAATSLTGAYSGMFTRDSSIQVMAEIAAHKPALAGQMLTYLLRLDQAGGLQRAPHTVPELNDLYYGNGVPAPSTTSAYVSQQEAGTALFLLGAPNNAAAQPFIPDMSSVTSVQATINNASTTGHLTAWIRTDYADPATTLGTASVSLASIGQTTGSVSFSFAQPVAVTPGTRYYLVLQADSTDGKVIWNGTLSPSEYQALPAYNYDVAALGGWAGTGAYPAFDIDNAPNPPLTLPTPDTPLLRLGGQGYLAAQQIPAPRTVTAVQVYLRRAEDTAGPLVATLRRGLAPDAPVDDRISVPASSISTTGSWVDLKFLPPSNLQDQAPYVLWLTAPRAPQHSITWYGETGPSDTGATFAQAPGQPPASVSGDASYQALTSTLNFDTADQPDGNYMLVLAWARYVAAEPQDTAFFDATYPTIRQFADYYFTQPGYLDSSLHLLRNPNLEHSRKNVYLDAYDLITNVFASEALHELAAVTRDADPAASTRWADTATQLAGGIRRNLTAEVDGHTVYAEMINLSPDTPPCPLCHAWSEGGQTGVFYPGFSWVNLAPVAANWFATDPQIMAATYQSYLRHASSTWQPGSFQMLNVQDDAQAVIGKGLAWEIGLNATVHDRARLTTLLEFVDQYTPGDLYPEQYWGGNVVSDPGNQEQSSWYVYEMLVAFPQLLGVLH